MPEVVWFPSTLLRLVKNMRDKRRRSPNARSFSVSTRYRTLIRRVNANALARAVILNERIDTQHTGNKADYSRCRDESWMLVPWRFGLLAD